MDVEEDAIELLPTGTPAAQQDIGGSPSAVPGAISSEAEDNGTGVTSNNGNNNNNTAAADDEGEEIEDEEEEYTLEDHAQTVLAILKPVAITIILVVLAVRNINLPNRNQVTAVMVYNEESSDSATTKLGGAVLNAIIMVGVIVVTTVIFVILFKLRCLKVIYGWLIASSGLMLGMFGGYLTYLLLQALNLPLDYITFSIFLWNFVIVGLVAIFWHAPTKVNQGYLIIISALLAIFFTRLPEWTTWAILAAVAIYDLFAVLCPRGPLKILVETAQQRKEPIPALLYNGSVVMLMSQQGDSVHTELGDEPTGQPAVPTEEGPQQERHPEEMAIVQEEERKKRSVKLGLGDFVFYSVLVGRAALFDMITVFTCFVAIITGLFFTLLLLAIFRKALPALPISIALGIVFFFLTRFFLLPFTFTLGSHAVFV